MIPEGLAGELFWGGRDEASEGCLTIPGGEFRFARGARGPVNGGEKDVVSYGGALATLWPMAVYERNEVNLSRDVVKGHDISEGGDVHALGPGDRLCALYGCDDLVQRA